MVLITDILKTLIKESIKRILSWKSMSRFFRFVAKTSISNPEHPKVNKAMKQRK